MIGAGAIFLDRELESVRLAPSFKAIEWLRKENVVAPRSKSKLLCVCFAAKTWNWSAARMK
jgi:hypothetical protein